MTEPMFVVLVRGPDGKPVLDKPLNDFPSNVRKEFWKQMTPFEREYYRDRT